MGWTVGVDEVLVPGFPKLVGGRGRDVLTSVR